MLLIMLALSYFLSSHFPPFKSHTNKNTFASFMAQNHLHRKLMFSYTTMIWNVQNEGHDKFQWFTVFCKICCPQTDSWWIMIANLGYNYQTWISSEQLEVEVAHRASKHSKVVLTLWGWSIAHAQCNAKLCVCIGWDECQLMLVYPTCIWSIGSSSDYDMQSFRSAPNAGILLLI